MIAFGERIKSLRLERQLKQEEFTAHGVSQSQLSQIENGHIPVSVDKVERLAKVLAIAAADLVAGTDLQDKYFAHRLTPQDLATREQTLSSTRSRRITAVEEAYKRIQLFHDLLYNDGDNRFTASVDNDAYYQHASRILRRATHAADEFDSDLSARLYVPESLLDEGDFDDYAIEQLRFRIKKSLAYVRSLVLEFPESDDPNVRLDIVTEIGLDKVDRHLRRFEINDSVDSTGTWRNPGGVDDNSLLEEEIPF